MSSRDVHITIQNNTDYSFSFSSKKADDGEFDSNPPSSVAAHSSGSFKVQKTSNASAHGPEGYASYTFSSGPNAYSFTINWDHPNDSTPSSYSVSTSSTQVSGSHSTTKTENDGRDQWVTYTIGFTPNALNEYDMVSAVTLGEVNSQLSTLVGEGLVPRDITQPADGSGDPALDIKLAGGVPVSPRLEAVPSSTSTVNVVMDVQRGTLTSGGSDVDLGGATITLEADLAAVVMDDPSQGAGTSDANQQLDALAGAGFTVYRLGVELTDPSKVRTCTVTGVSLTSAQKDDLVQCLCAYASSRENPDLLGQLAAVGVSQNGGADLPALPGFAPTHVELSATYRDDGSGDTSTSTINYLMMTRDRPRPTSSHRTSFSPLVTSGGIAGTFLVSREQLWSGYVMPSLLPDLSAAFGLPGSWTNLGTAWAQLIAAKDNYDLNDGRGEHTKDEDHEQDQYTKLKEQLTILLQPNLPAGVKATMFTGTGEVDAWAEVDSYIAGIKELIGKASYTQGFNIYVSLGVGTNSAASDDAPADIGSVVANVSGKINGATSDSSDGFVTWVTDTVSGWFSDDDKTFGEVVEDTLNDGMTDLSSYVADVQSTRNISTMTTSFVFPSGVVYQNSDLSVDGQGNLEGNFLIPG